MRPHSVSLLSKDIKASLRWSMKIPKQNPVITPDGAPLENSEQYAPAPVLLPNGHIWVFVKGAKSIYAWRSVNGCRSFQIRNEGQPVIRPGAPGQWDCEFALEPAAVYSPEDGLIHLWYKGTRNAAATGDWAWGHATAPGTDPALLEKDPQNPVLTSEEAYRTFGTTRAITDLAICDVIQAEGRFLFYGHRADDEAYRLIICEGDRLWSPKPMGVILSGTSQKPLVQSPTVFKMRKSGLYCMVFTEGSRSDYPRNLAVAISWDAVSWARVPGSLLEPGLEKWSASRVYCPAMLKTGPNFDQPASIGGKSILFYSGSANDKHSVGVAYLEGLEFGE